MEESICHTCEETKPAKSFYLTSGLPSSECRACVQVRARGLSPAGETKACPGCEESLPPDRFYPRREHYTGLSYYCRGCTASKTAQQRQKPGHRAVRRAHYAANQEKLAAIARQRYRSDPVKHKAAWWRSQGIEITAEEYLARHESQGGACAICGKDETENGKALAVDHDHDTGRVRGLLCDQCNRGLGSFKDSPDVLRRAIKYLGTN